MYGGLLGVGKTTVIRQLLRDPGQTQDKQSKL